MRIKFITFGCSRNLADSELMMGLLRKEGHVFVDNNPEVTVINTCFVKRDTESKIVKLMHEVKGYAVITGCLAQARPDLISAFPNFSFIGVGALERITEAVKEQIIDLSNGFPDFCSERLLINPLISIVPISEGCLGSCSYCCTKQARGVLKSRSVKSIIFQIINDYFKGAREFWLTSQDCGCYGFDMGSNISLLLDEIVKIEGDFRVRVGMMSPKHALCLLPSLRRSFDNPKIYRFIHLPVQSGSDKVLSDMCRGYSVNDFLKVARAFQGFTLSTDVICGFPTEGDVEWRETVNLIKEVRPDIININRFYSRPGTKASMLKQLPSRFSKDRSRELTGIQRIISLEKNKALIGKVCRLLVSESGLGRNEGYKRVNIKAPVGSFVNARITSAKSAYLSGEII